MTGVIWFVQVVHYPLFARVPPEQFVAYERAHVDRTGWVVGPPMLLEVGTAAYLLLTYPAIATNPAFLAAFALLLVVWLATAVFSVPLHRRLAQAPDARAVRRLVATNWIRTAGWTGRVALLAPVLLRTGSPPMG